MLMFRFIRNRKRQNKINKVKYGDGHSLEPYRLTDLFTRSLFYIKLTDEDNDEMIYAVNVNHFNENHATELYCDGKHIATSELPAAFSVPDGAIEVGTSIYGLSRMHYVTTENNEYPLQPDKWSTEGIRMRLDARFPRASSIIGKMAIVVLFVSLFVGLPQLASVISETPFFAVNFGSFVSPIQLPGWANTTLTVAGILAGVERALMLRNHWLIDIETTFWTH
ncbi:hypothetical protein [Aureibacillus halotolerans]|uniref:Uncharacterized protein n=1 Tax=Aureibacillus halotolerans TaxID=1508390 RepID=A0A4R6U8R5_9BACI|nr:hypothetical protein [Aureibacillus halotolerans]TDQ41189.1 hypothetical protein EV213_104187 [Aureibacillus halotolerans]